MGPARSGQEARTKEACPFSNPMSRGYFDGSSYYSPTIKLLCLGGGIGPATVMDEFGKRWRATPNEHGVETFHMSAVMAARKDVEGWDRKRTDELLKALANVFGNFYQRHLR